MYLYIYILYSCVLNIGITDIPLEELKLSSVFVALE